MLIEKDFIPAQGYECLNGCLCNYLKIWGTPLDTSLICFGGSGFKMGFKKAEKLYIAASVFESDFDFMKRYNIDYVHTELEDKTDIKNTIIKWVDEGRYFSIKLCSSFLKYHRVFSQNDSRHFISIVDYDLENNKFLIIDGFVPTTVPSTFFGWVDMEDILLGWAESDYDYVEFFKPDNLDVQKIKSDFKASVIHQLKEYLNKSEEIDGIVYGYKSFLRLFNELLETPEDKIYDVALDINYQIRIQGLIASRYYLRDAVGLLFDDKELYNSVDSYISKWSSICMMLVKASFKKKKDYLKTIFDNVSSVVESENILFNDIINKLSNE